MQKFYVIGYLDKEVQYYWVLEPDSIPAQTWSVYLEDAFQVNRKVDAENLLKTFDVPETYSIIECENFSETSQS